MIRLLICTWTFLCCLFLDAQITADIRLESTQQSGTNRCFNIDVRQAGGENSVMLAGQNYRFFYSSESLEFDVSGFNLKLSDTEYTFNLVQHRSKVDASKVGVLNFDNDLGFINASVILNGTNSRGTFLQKNTWMTLAEMCFNVIDDQANQHIVIARPNLTSDYGRAYVELSYVDAQGLIQSLPIQSVVDIQL